MNDFEQKYVGRRVKIVAGYGKGKTGVVVNVRIMVNGPLIAVDLEDSSVDIPYYTHELELLDEHKPDNTPLPLPG